MCVWSIFIIRPKEWSFTFLLVYDTRCNLELEPQKWYVGLLPWIIYILFVCRKLPSKVAWYHRIVFNLLSKKKKNGNFNLLYFKYMWKHTILFQEDHFTNNGELRIYGVWKLQRNFLLYNPVNDNFTWHLLTLLFLHL